MRLLSRIAGRALWSATARPAISLAGAAFLAIGCVILLPGVNAFANTDFTSFSAPLTGASDFAVDFPEDSATPPAGPIGMIDDGTNFFVSDYANSLLYKFPVTGGNASTVPTADDNLHDLALVNGIYFGTDRSTQSLVDFDPSTLELGTISIALPCPALGIAGDPLTGNVWADTLCGIFLVKNPTSVDPAVKRFSKSKDSFDGNAVSPNGQELWAADDKANEVVEFSRSGKVLASIPDPHDPDGIVFATPDTTVGGIDVSNNLFVNDNDGTIIRIDTNNDDQVSVVASGGTRGDYAIVGPDGCFYATQSDRVEQIAPCFFQSTSPTTTTTVAPTTTTTVAPTTTTTVAPTTTTTVAQTTTTVSPNSTTTTAMVVTAPTSATSTTSASPSGVVTASSGSLAFTGNGKGVSSTAIVGSLLVVLGLGLFLVAETRFYGRLAKWLLGR